LLVLTVAVAAIVVLLILPDVDPPDTAFHRGTAPIVLHARTSAVPLMMAAALPSQGAILFADDRLPAESLNASEAWFAPPPAALGSLRI
jgi:hypothetical protein